MTLSFWLRHPELTAMVEGTSLQGSRENENACKAEKPLIKPSDLSEAFSHPTGLGNHLYQYLYLVLPQHWVGDHELYNSR